MKTNDLIEAITRDASKVRARTNWTRLVAAGALGFLAALAGVVLFYGVRPDLAEALTPFSIKLGYWLIATGALLPLTLALLQPNVGVRALAAPAAIFIATSLIVGVIAALTAPAETRLMAWTMNSVPECLWRVPLLALPAFVIMTPVARALAPTRLTLAGAAAGALSGAIAGVAYVLFCPADTVAYVGTWYAASILVCAALGALAGRIALRW